MYNNPMTCNWALEIFLDKFCSACKQKEKMEVPEEIKKECKCENCKCKNN
jgi:hypothetical protein